MAFFIVDYTHRLTNARKHGRICVFCFQQEMEWTRDKSVHAHNVTMYEYGPVFEKDWVSQNKLRGLKCAICGAKLHIEEGCAPYNDFDETTSEEKSSSENEYQSRKTTKKLRKLYKTAEKQQN